MDTRLLPRLEAIYGPLDGESVPVAGLEVTHVSGDYVWIYHVVQEDTGARFLQLVATQPLHRTAA